MVSKNHIDRSRVACWTFGLVLFIFLLAFPVVYADSTQQYNKIYLNPFYRETLALNTNYSYLVSVNPPDRVQSVISAILGFNAQINGQTQNFTLWVNNRSCSNPSYSIATAFSATGNVQFYFDCTNVINRSGTYNITIRSAVNTGVVSGWLDLTYMNNPVGSARISGTDYFQGEKATVFLQLQDANGASVDNASCNFDLYNATNPISGTIYSRQPMVFRGADGIYYYQFSTAGLPEGVYPMDAICNYIYDNLYFYQGISQSVNVTTNTGTFTGGAASNLNAYDEDLYMGWTGTQNVTFKWNNVTSSGNITKIDLYWLGETSVGRTLTFYAFNYTSSSYNILLGAGLTSGSGSTTAPNGMDDIFSFSIPTAAYNGTAVGIQIVSSGSSTIFMNWLTLKTYANSSYVTSVKGSSEVHIYPTSPNMTVGINYSRVWDSAYVPARTLTDYNSSVIYANQQTILALLNGMSNLTAAQVWSFAGGRSLTFIDWQTGAVFVWNSTSRNLTFYNDTQIYNTINGMSNLTAAQVWNYSNRNLTEYNTSQIYSALLALQSNQNTINSTVTQILAVSQQINLTVGQTLAIAQAVNLTTVQTLQLLQLMNLTQGQILQTVNYINLTVNDIRSIVNNTNITVSQILAVSQAINLTTQQTLGIAIEMNLTSHQILTLLQSMNQTDAQELAYLGNINSTVTLNRNDLQYLINISNAINLTSAQTIAFLQAFNASAMGYLGEINSSNNAILGYVAAINVTAHNNALSLQQILGLANETNLTTQQILSLLQQINTTFEIKLDNMNNSVNGLLNLSREINATTHEVNVTVYQILSAVQGINFSQAIGYLQEINATAHYNNLTLQEILGISDEMNLTVSQTYGLLQFINVTFEQKLDNINNTVNNLSVNMSQLIGIAEVINLTASQTYQLLQAMNLTQSQIYSVLLGMNLTVSQILNLSNLTYINTNDILLLSFQTNSTVNQILGIVQGLNISINNTVSGNITLSSNLTSQSINDISEKVWLQFLTLGTPPPMPSTSYYCSDNVTLVKNITFDVCSGAGCKQYTKLTNSFCESGCDFKTNQCVPPPIERMGFIVVVIVGVLGFIVIVRRFT